MKLWLSLLAVVVLTAPVLAQRFVVNIQTLAELRAFPLPSNNSSNVFVAGRTVQGDGFEGSFTYVLGDTTATNLGTVFTSTYATAPAGRWKRTWSGPVSVRWFGATGNGLTDNLVPLTDCFNVASNSTRQVDFGPAPGAYVVSDTLIASGLEINLRGSELIFAPVGNKLDLQVRSNVKLYNGTVRNLGSSLTASGGGYHCPILVGSLFGETGLPNIGYTNIILESLTIDNNRTNGSGIIIASDSANVQVRNVRFPASSLLAAGVSINAGTDGLDPPVRTTHPNNILVENLKYGTNTAQGGGGGAIQAAVYISGAHNITVVNPEASRMTGPGSAVVYVTAGDFGYSRADPAIQPLAMQNIRVVNPICGQCQTIGIYADSNADNIGVIYPASISFEGGRLVGNGAANTAAGVDIARGNGITVQGMDVTGFLRGMIVDEAVSNLKVLGGRYASNYLSGIEIAGTTPPTDILIDGAEVFANDLGGTTNPGIKVRDSARVTIQNCVLGATSEATQNYGVLVDSTSAVHCSLYRNYVRGVQSGGVGYVLGAGGNFYNCIWEFAGNRCVAGVTFRSGLVSVPVHRWLSGTDIITDLTGSNDQPPGDGTWVQGSTYRPEYPSPLTNYTHSLWFNIQGGSPGSWMPVPLFYNVTDTQPETLWSKRFRVSGEEASVPGTVQSLTATNQILANAGFVRVVGNGGAVTLTNLPTIVDGFEGQRLLLGGASASDTVTIQDYRTLVGSNIRLFTPTVTLGISTNAGSGQTALLRLTFDPNLSLWVQESSVVEGTGVSGTLTNFSVGTMSPIFTVSSPTTYPLLSGVNPGGNRVYGWDAAEGVAKQMIFGTGASYDGASDTWTFTGGTNTTGTNGITSINSLTNPIQYLVTGTGGTDFNIGSTTDTHTVNLPWASATSHGKLSSTNWSTFNSKMDSLALAMPTGFSVVGSPATGAGSLTVSIPGGQTYYFLRGDGTGGVTFDNSLVYQAANDTITAVLGVVKRGRAGDVNGTPAANSPLGQFRAGGWNGSGYVLAPGWRGHTGNAWTGVDNGSGIVWFVVPNGGTSTSDAFSISPAGVVNVPNLTASRLVGTDSSKNLVSLSTGAGVTNSGGVVSANLAAGSNITLTTGSNGQITIASASSNGLDSGYQTRALADTVSTPFVTFTLPSNLTGGNAVIEGSVVVVTTGNSICVKTFTENVALGRVDALGGVTANTDVIQTPGETYCPGLYDIVISDATGTWGSGASATIELTAQACLNLACDPAMLSSMTCYFKVRTQGPITTTFPP